MRTLDKKLFRDLVRLWPQALAIALVVASGVATLILGLGAYQSLSGTRATYYERNAFADVFASVERAPSGLGLRIGEISGVMSFDLRIVHQVLMDIAGVDEPASGTVLSIPDHGSSNLNRLYMRQGRTPEPGKPDEAVVNEAFASANHMTIGSRFQANLNGRKRVLTIVGIALSPEFIYTLAPGELVPDDRRYGTLWMSEKALVGLFDLKGAFNAVALELVPGANEDAVIEALDDLLERYGGTGAYGRSLQRSHAFLDSELDQLKAMSSIVPPIFLVVSAFLMNMTMLRLIALEREQIGLLKALGYGRAAVALHYLKLVLIIAAIGIVIGVFAGTWLGRGMTRIYAEFFHFPFLVFVRDPRIYLLATGVSVSAAVIGALRSVSVALGLPPAVAMQPPVPPSYHRLWHGSAYLTQYVSQLTVMAVRYMVRGPMRAGTTLFGVTLATSLLVTSLFTTDSVESLIDVSFFMTARQDATINLSQEQAPRVTDTVAHLPGVLRAEPFRSAAVRLRNGHLYRDLALVGRPPGQDLSLVVDEDLRRIDPPRSGLLIGNRLADVLGIRPGDKVWVEFREGRRRKHQVVVEDIAKLYIGLGAFMDIDALNLLLGEGPRVSGANVSLDETRKDDFYTAVKKTPAVASLTLQRLALAKFRETIDRNINIMTTVYIALSVIIAFGVVYNSARIQLSERARELASLRVLGFTRLEVSRVLLTELVIIVLAAQPLGWLLGYLFAWAVIQGFASDLFNVPLVIQPRTYAMASIVVFIASTASALIVRRRIDRLDLVTVLKTRD